MNKSQMFELASIISGAVIDALKTENIIGNAPTAPLENANPKPKKNEKTAYQKTEQLLYNYMNFKKIIAEREREIEEIQLYGVPKKSKSITRYCGDTGGTVQGLVLEEDTVETAVQHIKESMTETLKAIALIDNAMVALSSDPYYPILEMRYFEGRTQEDIADMLKCSQVTVSKNKGRLINELAMRLFPNQVVREMIS